MPWLKATIFIPPLLLAVSAGAEQSACLERTIPVSVSMAGGEAAPELSTANLAGTFQKKPVVVKLAEIEKRPPRIILLVDTSGSMEQSVNASIDVAEAVLAMLPHDVEAGLAFFAAQTVPVMLPTTDRARLLYQLEALRKDRRSFNGKTALWSAVLESVKMFGTPVSGDSVYMISDGGENQSKARESDAEAALESVGVRLFALVLPPGPFTSRAAEELTGPGVVQSLVRSTGGTAIFTAPFNNVSPVSLALVEKGGSPTQLGHNLERQINELLKFYRVEIVLPEAVGKPGDLKLDLVGLGKPQRDKLILAYPAKIFPCH